MALLSKTSKWKRYLGSIAERSIGCGQKVRAILSSEEEQEKQGYNPPPKKKKKEKKIAGSTETQR